ncbi:ATPase V1 complex subunit H [Gilbertella persicaria]|uniref:ATPase V1 complex subunit H n=1 Tax=Gilbertella persicaria TaxID=101096 RepID=UPI002220BBCD|nr:ATPase V1 complex subunit H [Gilbertella persicaria]KAI8074348.1 ATPase V1 complex subunit H [Gilbertella persicaria]
MSEEIPEVPLVLISNPYLEKKAAVVRQKPILWEGYERASLLKHEQVELIKAIDKKSASVVQNAMNEKGQTYASLIMYLLQNLSRPDTVQYVCLMTDDIFIAHEDNTRYFHETAKEDPSFPFGPFIKILETDDDFMALEASKVLTMLACSAPSPSNVDLSALFRWITNKLSGSNSDVVHLVIQELESILRVNTYRLAVWHTQNAVKELTHRLFLNKTASTPQIQYQIIFCLWLLTFEPEIAANINEKYDIIPLLVEIAKSAIKEKVIRVSVATLRNLVEKAPAQNLAAMLVTKLLPFTENLSTRKWSDTDILDDINFIKERLQENFQSLTTFEQYASEVETGKLEWSPPHKSEVFWKENAQKLEDNNYQLLKALARLLSTSSNPLVLAIAASDIGYYVKHATKTGRNMLQEIGAKQRIMELMTHEDQEVRYQALLAVQKYMHQAW